MRTAALVGAAEYGQGPPGRRPAAATHRQVVDSVLLRADEPGELLAYWTSAYGRNIPKPVKRGVADAVRRLYNEQSLLKYDTGVQGLPLRRRPQPRARVAGPGQAVAGRPVPVRPRPAPQPGHGRPPSRCARCSPPTGADGAAGRGAARAGRAPEAPERLARGGHDLGGARGLAPGRRWTRPRGRPSSRRWATWRCCATCGTSTRPGVCDEVAAGSRRSSPTRRRSRARGSCRCASSPRTGPRPRCAGRRPLEQALTASARQRPRAAGPHARPGRHVSSSMHAVFAREGTLMRWHAAALFGIALGRRCERADVVSFSSAQRYAR